MAQSRAGARTQTAVMKITRTCSVAVKGLEGINNPRAVLLCKVTDLRPDFRMADINRGKGQELGANREKRCGGRGRAKGHRTVMK